MAIRTMPEFLEFWRTYAERRMQLIGEDTRLMTSGATDIAEFTKRAVGRMANEAERRTA